jgi:hypothetical protein
MTQVLATRFPVDSSDLRRCCLRSLDAYGADEGIEEEGVVIFCAHCDSPIVLANGVWQWHSFLGNYDTLERIALKKG